MSDESVKEEEEQTFLDLSDEEIMKMGPPKEDLEINEEEDEASDTPEATEATDDSSEESEESEEGDESTDDDEAGEEEEEEKPEEGADDDVSEKEEEDTSSNDDEESDDKVIEKPVKRPKLKTVKKADKEEKEPSDGIDYEAEYNKITAPFKANGRTMHITKAEDIISLLQMGANYNSKMRGLKPHLKLIKMLDNNKLLDENKISYLIDLDKHNPEAITKLIKDSGIDPLNVDVEEDSKYKTNTNYNVSDKEVELDEVLDSIQETDSYQETINIISNKWDKPSKRIILENPTVIKTINDHIADGIYEQIASVVEQERVLGHLTGLSDLQAYQQVGDYMQENQLFEGQSSKPSINTSPKNKSKAPDPKLKKRKLAAGGTKNTPSSKGKKDFDPLAMDDDEFEKLSANDYLN